jgi:hypothetical protein
VTALECVAKLLTAQTTVTDGLLVQGALAVLYLFDCSSTALNEACGQLRERLSYQSLWSNSLFCVVLQAVKLLRRMQAEDQAPDTATYNAVIVSTIHETTTHVQIVIAATCLQQYPYYIVPVAAFKYDSL